MLNNLLFNFICNQQAIAAPIDEGTSTTSSNAKLFQSEVLCSRFYLYHNKILAVDSSRKKDGEGLRPILSKNPEAERLLSTYQANQPPPSWPAYVGTLGVLTLIGGNIAAREVFSGSRIPQRNFRLATTILGGSLAIGSYVYTQVRLHRNEKNLEKAVSVYNASVSTEDRVRIGFEPSDPSEGGAGGQVKTQFQF